MTALPTNKPWYSCFLCACCKDEPSAPPPTPQFHAAPAMNFHPGAVDAKIAAAAAKQNHEKNAEPDTPRKLYTQPLPTSRRHRKLNSTEAGSVFDMLNGNFRPPNEEEAIGVDNARNRRIVVVSKRLHAATSPQNAPLPDGR